MSYITDLFETHWDSDIVDRTDKVKAQKERLAATREKTVERSGKMATPLRPTEASQKASKTYSEQTRRQQ